MFTRLFKICGISLTILQRLVFLTEANRCHVSGGPSLAAIIRELRPWFTVGSENTFHALKSLQHRATSLVMSTQNEPSIKWKSGSKQTALLVPGGEVSLEGLQQCQGDLEDATLKLLTQDLLFGHTFPIDIAALKDDMGNKEPGYSLFTDRINQEILGPIDQLAQHILETPALCAKFVLDVQDGEILWNAVSLSSWLAAYAQLNLLCLVQVEMNCGAPARTTELTGMPRYNTPQGMLRAMRIIDNHIALMRTYHKMRAAQGQDRVIPHSLNAALGAVFIYKEAVCHPFAQLCASILFPNDHSLRSLYRTHLFVNYDKQFTGDHITQEMKRWTVKHLGVALGVRTYRQYSTPLRRVHAGLQEMWLEDSEDTVDSLQAGHSHRVDWMRYGVTDMSATGLPEDYIGPFLATSVMWHRILHLVPGMWLLCNEEDRLLTFCN